MQLMQAKPSQVSGNIKVYSILLQCVNCHFEVVANYQQYNMIIVLQII